MSRSGNLTEPKEGVMVTSDLQQVGQKHVGLWLASEVMNWALNFWNLIIPLDG